MPYVLLYHNKNNTFKYFSKEPKYIFTGIRRFAKQFPSIDEARSFSIPSMYDKSRLFIINLSNAPEDLSKVSNTGSVLSSYGIIWNSPPPASVSQKPSPSSGPKQQPSSSIPAEPAMPDNESIWPGLPPGEPSTTISSFHTSSSPPVSALLDLYASLRTIKTQSEQAMQSILSLLSPAHQT